MNALLAIKPEFANKILSGDKEYEFRRSSFKNAQDIDFVYLYSSSPVMKIVGGFSTDRIVEANPSQLWQLFNEQAGIDYDRFMEYFDEVETGYAIQIDDTYQFEEPIDPKEVFDEFSAPVSFLYLDKEHSKKLEQHLPSNAQTPKETSLRQYADGGF